MLGIDRCCISANKRKTKNRNKSSPLAHICSAWKTTKTISILCNFGFFPCHNFVAWTNLCTNKSLTFKENKFHSSTLSNINTCHILHNVHAFGWWLEFDPQFQCTWWVKEILLFPQRTKYPYYISTQILFPLALDIKYPYWKSNGNRKQNMAA